MTSVDASFQGDGIRVVDSSKLRVIHVFTLVALGVNLLDNLALHELAATADKLKRLKFMLVIQPLRVDRGAGSAVNPTAIF